MSTSRSSTQFEHSAPKPRYAPCWFLLVRIAASEYSHVLDPVRADDLGERVAVRAGAELEVRAVVVDAADAQRAEGAVVVEGELGVVPAIGAGVVVVRDVRGAVFDVLHRLPDELREETGERRHLVHEELRAEAAPAAMGTTLNLLVGIFSDPAISQWKYVKVMELA